MAQYDTIQKAYRDNNDSIFEAVMLADKDGNIINTSGSASNVPLSAGLIEGYSHINKFGFTDTLGASFETIWDGSGLYPFIDVAGTATVSGTDVGTVRVQGLDANWEPVEEVVSIGGTTTASFLRIFRVILCECVGGINAADIDVTVGGVVRASILAGNGQTLMSVYTIPAGKTGYLLKFQGSIEKGKEVKFAIMVREHTAANGTFNIKGMFGSFGVPITYDYPVPLRFTEKTDIDIRALAGATTGAGAIFDIILVDNV